MKISPYQTPELRNESDAVIQVGTYGKYTPFANADNTGILDYINNNLEALKNALSGAYVYVANKSSLPASGDVTKIYVTQDDGKSYKWTGTEWSLLTSQLNGLSAYEIAQTLGFTGTEEEWIMSIRGEKGDSITGATVDSDGYLILTLDTGTTIKTALKPLVDAKQYADNAASSASTATSQANIATSQAQNASSSATSAANSAKASSVSEGNAKASADDASSSATNAKTAMNTASAAASSASTSATNASASASNAKTSASEAESSNQQAKKWAIATDSPDGTTDTGSSTGKTQSARSWALSAKASADNAKTSESNAKTSETNASASAANASNSASEASKSSTSAEASNQSAKRWAVATDSPDGATDTDSSTGKTQSARSWALAAQASAAHVDEIKRPVYYLDSDGCLCEKIFVEVNDNGNNNIK